jgi:hypothetical protein
MFLRVATLAALLFAPFYAQAPAKKESVSDLPDAREIINRHIKAIGGREAILALKSMHATGTLAIPASGISGPMEIVQAPGPDRSLVKMTMPGIGEIMEGFDGSHGWSVNPMTGAMLKVGKELTQTKLDADFFAELRDPQKFPVVKTVEKTTFDGRPCYKVSLQRIDGVEDFDFYDVATGLRAGSMNTRETFTGVVSMTQIETGYKRFGKLMQATLVTQQVMGIEQKITLLTVEYDKVEASAFEPPPAVKALIK